MVETMKGLEMGDYRDPKNNWSRVDCQYKLYSQQLLCLYHRKISMIDCDCDLQLASFFLFLCHNVCLSVCRILTVPVRQPPIIDGTNGNLERIFGIFLLTCYSFLLLLCATTLI
jgi:hypothetical protein